MKNFSLFFCIFFFSISYSQKGIEIELSASKIEVGEDFVLTYHLTNLDERRMIPPNFSSFKFLGGPQTSSSSNISNYNGTVTRTMTRSYSFYLQGLKIGKYTIPKCVFEMSNGQMVETAPVSIEVVKKGALPRNSFSSQNDPFFDPNDPFASFFNQGTPQGRMQSQQAPQQQQIPTDASKIDLKKDIFARIVLDKTTAYVGEQINASVKIYTAVNSAGFEAEKVPSFNGFWSQDIKLPEKLEMKREIINGREFVSVEIKKMVLFPTSAGNLEITPLKMKTNALVPVQVNSQKRNRRQPRDLFEAMQQQMEDMMNGNFAQMEYKQIPYSFTSGSVKVNVLPLPSQAPSSFTGAVGRYKMNAYCNKKELKTDDALNYTIEINGTGNLPLVNNPTLTFDKDFEIYDPTIKENYNIATLYGGSKSWNYVAIPHNPGNYQSPAYEFTYFDLGLKKYVSLKSDPTPLHITGNPTQFKEKGKKYDQGNYSKKELLDADSRVSSSGIGISLWQLMLIILPALIAIIYRIAEKDSNVVSPMFLNKKKLNALAQKQLKRAHQYFKEDKKQEFLDETTKCLWNYIGNKLKIEPSSLNRDNIEEQLKSNNVSQDTIHSLIALLDHCEMGLYTSSSSQNLQQTYEDAVAVVAHLEEQLKSK